MLERENKYCILWHICQSRKWCRWSYLQSKLGDTDVNNKNVWTPSGEKGARWIGDWDQHMYTVAAMYKLINLNYNFVSPFFLYFLRQFALLFTTKQCRICKIKQHSLIFIEHLLCMFSFNPNNKLQQKYYYYLLFYGRGNWSRACPDYRPIW